MSIGAELAQARRRAGLTVSEVSRQTRIRETIIRGIEHDDYSACGGDFYARGDIRSIARAVGADPGPLIREYDATQRAPEEITAAEAFQPATPIRVRERRRMNWTAVLAAAVLAAIGFAAYYFISGSGSPRGAAAAGSSPGPAGHRHSGQAKPAATRDASSPAVPAVRARRLVPVRAAAFGPGGPSRGDNPQLASLAIDGDPATAWQTSWYATARFGNLKSGTGLLLDLGRPVTITSARITLDRTRGADVQLRAGSAPALASLPRVAGRADAGGVLWLRLTSPARARYVLIWFTRLPPDPAGTFRESVHGVRLYGRP